jgi:hypothetical protein
VNRAAGRVVLHEVKKAARWRGTEDDWKKGLVSMTNRTSVPEGWKSVREKIVSDSVAGVDHVSVFMAIVFICYWHSKKQISSPNTLTIADGLLQWILLGEVQDNDKYNTMLSPDHELHRVLIAAKLLPPEWKEKRDEVDHHYTHTHTHTHTHPHIHIHTYPDTSTIHSFFRLRFCFVVGLFSPKGALDDFVCFC